MKIVFSYVGEGDAQWWSDDLELFAWEELPAWLQDFMQRMEFAS